MATSRRQASGKVQISSWSNSLATDGHLASRVSWLVLMQINPRGDDACESPSEAKEMIWSILKATPVTGVPLDTRSAPHRRQKPSHWRAITRSSINLGLFE